MLEIPGQSGLLEHLYESIVNPNGWGAFLAALAGEFRATATTQNCHSQRGAARAFEPSQPKPSADPQHVPYAALAPTALPLLSATPDGSLRRSDGGAEPGRGSAEDVHALETSLFDGRTFEIKLVVTRPRAEECFSPDETRHWSWLAPHIGRVAYLRMQFVHSQIVRESALGALEALGIGSVIADGDGALLFASPVGGEILARGEGLTVSQGRLRAAPAIREDFERRLHRVTSQAGRHDPGGEILALPRNHGERPISAVIMPPAERRHALAAPSVTILLYDVRRHTQVRAGDLAYLYGLTAAEGKLLRELIAGVPLAQYAAAAGIARNTAKTYLHQIFNKTGQSRQADLIREVLSDPVLRLAPVRRFGG